MSYLTRPCNDKVYCGEIRQVKMIRCTISLRSSTCILHFFVSRIKCWFSEITYWTRLLHHPYLSKNWSTLIDHNSMMIDKEHVFVLVMKNNTPIWQMKYSSETILFETEYPATIYNGWKQYYQTKEMHIEIKN